MYTRTYFHWNKIFVRQWGYYGWNWLICFVWCARYRMSFLQITEVLITPKPTVFKPG